MTSPALSLRDRLIPWYIVAFFAVIALVDGVMVTLAVRSQPGLITDHAYEKGLDYNRAIEAEEKQTRLGWKSSLSILAVNGNAVTLRFDLRDQDGAHISPNKAVIWFRRPAQANNDFSVPLTGMQTHVNFPAKGVWDARVEAVYNGHRFQHNQRIIVK